MTSIETGPSWVERLNPRHWTLVWKLVIVGLVPALLALALGVLRIADQAGSAADLGRSGRLLETRNEIVAAATALRGERDQATLFAASNGNGNRVALDSSRQRADEALTTMRGGLTAATSDFEPATVAAMQRTQDSLDLIVSLRQTVTGTPSVPYDQVVNRYTNVIGAIDVLDRAILRQQRTPTTAGLADASSAVTSALEQLSIQHAILAGAIRAGKPLPGDPAVVNAATAQLVNNYRDYQAALTPEQLAKFGNLPDTSATSRMDQLRSAILTAPFQLGPLARDWDAAYDQARQSTDRTAGLISTELSATAAAAAQRASNLAGINSVILMLGLLIGITIAVLVARSLIRSLRLLRSSALDVAERRLPQAVESMRAGEAPDVAVEPVPIGTRDEVGQVARAFDAVHGQAVRLAAEQAALQANVSAMFINLSRRSQALVERQLQLIEALESNEQDADQLSNLFQLDHLATRMRRNSENLLVLAGTDLAKRNMAPVPVVDVLRAAVSEVEQYQRVVVQAPPAASIAGRAGSDLVHLLAELLDNATAFSPPESQVVMSTTRSPDGAIVIEISDRGVGMADDELADANTRLVGPAAVDVSASRRMGLFVVGRLAARHGVGVRLASTAAGPGSGLTASVSVPPSLIPTGVPADAPRPAGVPMPAGIPAQGGRPGEARPQRPEPNGARSGSLSALVTGADAPGNAPHAARDASAAGSGQSALFAGKPPVNGTTAHGLPARRPGSSLRPEGPPPTEAPPGGFFDDGGPGESGERPPGEQARLDQEAAARRDRMGGGSGLAPVPPVTGRPNEPGSDERSVPDDERSPSEAEPTDRPRLTKDLAETGDRPAGGAAPSDTPARDTAGPSGPGRPGSPDTSGADAEGAAGPETARIGPLPDTRRPDAPGPDTASERDTDAGDGTRADAARPGGLTGPGAAAAGAAAAGWASGRTDAPTDQGSTARPGPAGPSGTAPSGAAPTGGSRSGATPAGGIPSGVTPSSAFPLDAGPPDRTPSDARPSEGLPSDARPSDRTSSTATPSGEFPSDARSSDRTPSSATPSGGFASGTTPSDRTPSSATPSGAFGSGTTPSDGFWSRTTRSGGYPPVAPGSSTSAPGATSSDGAPAGAASLGAGAPHDASYGASGTEADSPNATGQGALPARGDATGGHTPVQGSGGQATGWRRPVQDPDAQATGGHLPPQGYGAQGYGPQATGGHAPAWGAGDQSDVGNRPAGVPGRRPGDMGGYAYRAFTDAPDDDTATPTTGTDPLPRRVAGPPSPAGPGPRPGGQSGGPAQTGQYRTDQQARPPEQYRSVSGPGGFPPAPPLSGPAAPPPSRRPSPAPDPADELFAPRVPSLDPDGDLPGHDPHASAFDLGETTPIFEEIASAWFRSNRPVPVSWESDTGSHPVVPPTADDTDPAGVTRSDAPTPTDARASAADGWGQNDARSPVGTPADGWPSVGRPTPGPADILADAGDDTPPSARPSAVPPPGPTAPFAPAAALPPTGRPPSYPSAPATTPSGPATRSTNDAADTGTRLPEPTPADFSTEADEGWLAASGAVAERPDELTAAGLPKRRPRARLIPGSAGSAVMAPPVTAARSAESIRGRLASYQQGVRQGRETRLRGHGSDHPTSPAAPGADHDEESS